MPVTISSTITCRRVGRGSRRRVTSHEPSAKTAMIAQVVTTGRLIATGPRWKRTVLTSGEAAIMPLSAPRAGFGGDAQKNDCSHDAAERPGRRQETRPGAGEAVHGTPQRREIGNAEGKPGHGENCGERKAGRGHARSIRCQASQQPSARPATSKPKVQKIPEAKFRSSQRPAKMPITVGVTIVQPSAPIIARFWPI